MDTTFILSIIFVVMGFITANVIAYKSFGSLNFWDIVIFGALGVCVGALIGVLVAMVVVSIVF